MAKPGLSVLAHVPNLHENARKHCAMREKRFPYFREGWVSLELGRHTNYTDAIRAATKPDANGKSYAVADEQGQILQRYSTFANAVKAKEGVTRTLPALEVEDEVAPVAASSFVGA